MTSNKITSPQCCQDILTILFQLNSLDYQVFKKLKTHDEIRADDLAKLMKKERSTVYRSLQKLIACGICIKSTKTLKGGGYYHTYSCNDVQAIKKNIHHCIETWYHQMHNLLQNIEKELNA